MKGIVPVGAPAPDFALPADRGVTASLAGLRGQNVVLYFYPRAGTPGCTREAIEFNRLRGAFARAGTAIVGVSADPVSALDRFKAKHRLAIRLASDETHRMIEAYGAWGEKQLYGRKFRGVIRMTYLIDRNGRVARVWPRVRVAGHAAEVLEAARAL
jgi:peroxiredoxin Q/BCP